MANRRQQNSQAGKRRGYSPAGDNPEPQGFWPRVVAAYREDVQGNRERDGSGAAADSSKPHFSDLWEFLKSYLSIDVEDEDQLRNNDNPYHWKYFRTNRPGFGCAQSNWALLLPSWRGSTMCLT